MLDQKVCFFLLLLLHHHPFFFRRNALNSWYREISQVMTFSCWKIPIPLSPLSLVFSSDFSSRFLHRISLSQPQNPPRPTQETPQTPLPNPSTTRASYPLSWMSALVTLRSHSFKEDSSSPNSNSPGNKKKKKALQDFIFMLTSIVDLHYSMWGFIKLSITYKTCQSFQTHTQNMNSEILTSK